MLSAAPDDQGATTMRRLPIAAVLASLALLLVATTASTATGATLKYGNPPAAVPTSGSSLQGVLATGTTSVLQGTLFGSVQRVVCTTSTLNGSFTGNPATPVTGLTSSIAFANCINSTLGTPCTVVFTSLPWTWTLTPAATGTNVAGTFAMTFRFTLSGCLAGQTCSFQGSGGGTSTTISGAWTGANLGTSAPATVNFVSSPLTVTTVNCGSGWTFTAKYALTATVGGVGGRHLTLDNP
jgi:hypothetical protein